MKRTSSLVSFRALLALALPSVCGAQADPVTGIPYVLGKEAKFEAGCLPPCMCPILMRSPLSGTFTLVRGSFDGLFQHYEVRDVNWALTASPQTRITGKGTYRVGGEFATQHEMILDLSVNGAPAQTYSSGLVQGGGSFPRIDISVALHGFFCHDSVYYVQAHPSGTTGVEPTSQGALSLRASPNPFAAETRIDFGVSHAGRVDLRILDAAGRQVRALVRGRFYDPGAHAVTWDGRRDNGQRAAPGVYFVDLTAGTQKLRWRLVRF